MAHKPPPRHVKPTARQVRRAVPRHAIEPEVPFAAVTTLAITVAGAVVVASSAYGYSPSPGRLAGIPSGISIPVATASAADTGVAPDGLDNGANTEETRRVSRALERAQRDSAPAAVSPRETAIRERLEAERRHRPAFVTLPSIRTVSSLITLGLEDNGVLEVPEDFLQAGWYELGPRPGDPGPAIIAGHLDSKVGPGIFSRLPDMKPGDVIQVTRVDGVVLDFEVTRVDQYPKTAFPTRQVYGPTDAAELRVITCGGSFDRKEGSYNDNIVVFARLATDDLAR